MLLSSKLKLNIDQGKKGEVSMNSILKNNISYSAKQITAIVSSVVFEENIKVLS